MRMGQRVRTGLGHGASPVSYRPTFLVYLYFIKKNNETAALLKTWY